LTNASALTALQSLQMTEQNLNQTQNQISTGLSVSSAADNASYWSIATQMTSDNGVLGAVSNSLGETSSILDVANSALNSVISTINNIKNDLADAANPGADLTAINADLTQQGNALLDAINGASFNGTNLLNGSGATTLNFVSGFQETATGGAFDTIQVQTQSLYTTGTNPQTTTVDAPDITDAATVTNIQGLTDNTATVTAATYGQDMVVNGATDTNANPDQVSVTSVDINGVQTTTTYTALDSAGDATTVGAAATFGVQVATTSPGGSGLLNQGGIDLTKLDVTTSNVDQYMTAVNAALGDVTTYASQLGSTQSRVNSQATFLGNLSDALTTGIASLVDANMNQASTQLQALQTQQQLGIQSLSIANQNTQLILKLFGA
jgi:flagellin